MAVTESPTTRLLTINMPADQAAWQLVRMQGVEKLSELYQINCEVICNQKLSQADLGEKYLGKPVCCAIHTEAEKPRYLHGHINSINLSHYDYNELRRYEIEIVPVLWWLSLDQDSRTYQRQTIPQIITSVLGRHRIRADSRGLTANYPERNYLVQNQESSYHFLLRLMEEVGIHYYFRHEKNRHTLVLADDSTTAPQHPIPLVSTSDLHLNNIRDNDDVGYTHSWAHHAKSKSQLKNLTKIDYNFAAPDDILQSSVHTGGQNPQSNLEYNEYPGNYQTPQQGEQLIRLQQHIRKHIISFIMQKSSIATLQIGMQIDVIKHCDMPYEQGKYFITSITHDALADMLL